MFVSTWSGKGEILAKNTLPSYLVEAVHSASRGLVIRHIVADHWPAARLVQFRVSASVFSIKMLLVLCIIQAPE